MSRPNRNAVTTVPFRGWRIAPDHLNALATRYSSPWDSGSSGPDVEPTFRTWQRRRAVVRDRRPCFYAYEQTGPQGTLRGLLGAVHLDSRLLSHEDVIPEQVYDLTDVMHSAAMNLDPMVLGYPGDGRTAEHLARIARTAPSSEVLADDGQLHRVWCIPDHETHDDVSAELSARVAFIADGHHRYVAARQYRRDYYAAGYGQGPWDYVCGLLVDVKRTRMRLAPVHRLLPYADPRSALAAASARFRVRQLPGDLREWLSALKEAARYGPAFVVVTSTGAFLLAEPDPAWLDHVLRGCTPAVRQTHLAVLHHGLVDELWRTPALPEYVGYESSAARVVDRVRRQGGLAVLVTAVTQRDLQAAAAGGVRLPRKSTAFGPKPHPGLVFRTLEPEADPRGTARSA